MSNPVSIAPAMARHLELWPIDRLVPYARNARTHSPAQVAQIAASIAEFGFNSPILVASGSGVVAGHGRLLAARKLGLAEVPVVVLDHLSETQKRAYLIADNKLSDLAGWDEDALRIELAELREQDVALDLLGFSEAELAGMFADEDTPAAAPEGTEEEIPDTPVEPVTRPGDLWLIGPHRLICGDCRDTSVVGKLFDGRRANVVVTSPPYATRREYDPASGFRPVAPEDYVKWYRDVAAALATVLTADGSYFLNIKEHAEDGQRHLYVKDLFIAHVREWDWRFVDEFCWRKTDNGVPGGWNNRFKNAWEPIAHFSRAETIKFHPYAVGHRSEDCFDYSPDNPKSTSGSGLLGTGARGDAAGKPGSRDEDGRYAGIARPSNVIDAKTESSQGSHSAPFPRAIPEFFIKAFSDAGDIAFDPFLGSGTTMAAAHVVDRAGYGIEISPAYCDVILRRIEHLTSTEPVLVTGEKFNDIAAQRGVSGADGDLRLRDAKSIRRKPNGMPCYAPKGAAR
ncbi:MAG: ParB N-terminal domain-containing protein [Bryobacterales bacterium]|nr:ParB N-terminal domain-containing protein [Bryobacterales bacterium]